MKPTPPPPDGPQRDIDRLLHAYYRNEMPRPWPSPPAEDATAPPREAAWGLPATRLLVGASLVALVLAYLGISGFFPRPHAPALDPNQSQTIGHRPGLDPAKPAVRPMP